MFSTPGKAKRMKTLAALLIVTSLAIATASRLHARNVTLFLPIAAALEFKDVEARPTGAVKFFFGAQKTPDILTRFGTYSTTPRSAAAGGISDEKACYGAFHWTLANMEDRAQRLGANAVVNIVSFYKRNEMSSAVEFECHVGNVIASVFLRGDFVKIAAQ
jgi:hypothetical protein